MEASIVNLPLERAPERSLSSATPRWWFVTATPSSISGGRLPRGRSETPSRRQGKSALMPRVLRFGGKTSTDRRRSYRTRPISRRIGDLL